MFVAVAAFPAAVSPDDLPAAERAGLLAGRYGDLAICHLRDPLRCRLAVRGLRWTARVHRSGGGPGSGCSHSGSLCPRRRACATAVLSGGRPLIFAISAGKPRYRCVLAGRGRARRGQAECRNPEIKSAIRLRPGSALAWAGSLAQGTCATWLPRTGAGGLAGCSHPDPVRNQNKGSSERERLALGSGTHLVKAVTDTARRSRRSRVENRPGYRTVRTRIQPLKERHVTGKSHLSGRDIGAIEIADRFSLVEVPESAADDVVAALRQASIKGKRATVRRERYPVR